MEKEDFYQIIKGEEILSEDKMKGLEALVEKFPYFQIAQIFYLKNLKELNRDTNVLLNLVAVSVPDRKKLYRFLHTKSKIDSGNLNFSLENENQTEISQDASNETQSKNSLIDKFLASNPGSVRPKQDISNEFQNVENEIADNSEKEDEEVVTETLAMIYLQQKKYDKALNAFQKLSLKYPEKSVYFASRIKEIEGLKNI